MRHSRRRWRAIVRRGWLGLVAGLLTLSFCATVAARPAAAQSSIERPFELVDVSGHTVTDQDLRGRWLLVFFGYTFCPDICPTTLGDVTAAMERLGPLATKVQPIFISVDPQRDTPAVMRDFLGAFDARILGLTGTEAQIARVAAKFGVTYFRTAEDESQDYAIAHSAAIHIVGPEGGLVTQLSGTADANRIATTLQALIQ
jgi:protein SCO1/2